MCSVVKFIIVCHKFFHGSYSSVITILRASYQKFPFKFIFRLYDFPVLTEEIHKPGKILIPVKTGKNNDIADKSIVCGERSLNENLSKLNNKLHLTDRSVSVMDGDKIETLNINEVLNENTEKSQEEKFSELKDLLNEILVKNENSGHDIQNELKKSISSFKKSLSKKFEKSKVVKMWKKN